MCVNFCERHKVPNGVDMLRFWVEIDELQLLPSHSYTHRRLRKIYDKFLSPEAQSPVCVTGAMLAEIEKQLEGDNNLSAGMYADAQAICLVALERSVFPRFRDSKLFKKMQDFCAPVVPNSNSNNSANQPAADTEDYSLMDVLNHPAKLRFLKTFCMEALALENLLFYLEVEDCKRLPNLSFITNKTRKIYDRYCCPSSKSFIQIDESTLRELHATVESKAPLLPKMFYEAQLIVFNRISDEIWRTFCRTHEYLEFSKHVKPDHGKAQRKVKHPSQEQTELAQKKLETMNEFQLIEVAMHYPVEKLIPIKYHVYPHGALHQGSTLSVMHAIDDDLTPHDLLNMILGDSYAKKYFLQFMKKRGVDQLFAFCAEVEDFKLLPGIEFLQHSAKKIYRKYMMPSAKLQVDMSTAMRDEIYDRLHNPSVDMFKKIATRVRHGMLQDSLLRFVKSPHYHDLKKHVKQTPIENELKEIDLAAKRGKMELQHLDIVLQNQASIRQFRLFLEQQHCSENLMLWEEIEHYRRLPSYQIVLRSAKKIYDKYLNPANTRMAITLSDAPHKRVLDQIESASRTTFDEVENECYEVMRNIVVPDFLDSRIFMTLVGTWAVVSEDYPAEMLRGEFEMAFLRHRFHLVQETKGLSRDSSTPLLEKQHNTGNLIISNYNTTNSTS
uniref:RGS domain-containing protein n=1 Tax=Globisporangium ultimum (strain ATCC 200006 / CBS 805.95 / DAOM BR144) TaxID=431595 RepID=K3WXC3_GLOUD